MNKKVIRVMDLFAGAGGFGLGFGLASEKYILTCSLEVDKWAVETLKANNYNEHLIIQNDIRTFDTDKKIKEACSDKPDIIIGGPPCQGFSLAGPAKDPTDPRNSLFKNYAQWVKVHKPKIFVMENVRGILTGKNEKGEKVIDIIKRTFESIGYTVNIWELNAANFGVPQSRERVFIVGSKKGMKIPPPQITHYLPSEKIKLNGSAKHLTQAITVIEAIGDLPFLRAGEGHEVADYAEIASTQFQISSRKNADKIYNHVTMSHTKRIVKRYEEILNGVTIDKVSEDLKVRKRNGNGVVSETEYNSNYRHLKPDMISYTIPASFYSNFVHPNQPRNITSREAARLQSFPDNYVFKGKRTQISSKLLKQLGKDDENHLSQYNQIGNAVPPLLSKAIAQHLLEYLK
ncbi:DNA cytosine methyltransferase [Mucilaginibacter terrigena]|uniref:Cytosine-specific methyltransferase n=1 Tax=Mucilaginibacter terrigena TaxID=2492395 RepID=A0A4Q5LL27_9SPHI|nr:DNA cytosine methyltransferase [Mucilaginibacter terrigena]RYU86235.1 DNA cytosine methyltransferase [Mucilaginibacter terrigena]